MKPSLTARSRKGHHGQLIRVHRQLPFFLLIESSLVSLGTTSNQGLEFRTFSRRIVIMLGGLVRANFIIVLDLIKLVYRAQFPLITLFLIPFVYLLIRVLIILPLNYIMINKNGGRDRRLIRNAGLLVELSFPTVSSFQGLRVRSVGHDNAPRDMPGVQRLESSGRVHVGALVP